MSFAQEMKDFLGGWTAVNDMSSKSRALDLQKQEIENLKAYRDAGLEIDREQLDLSRSNADRNYALAVERNRIAKEAAAKGEEADFYNNIYDGLGEEGEGAPREYNWDEVGAPVDVAPAPAPAPATQEQAIPAPSYDPVEYDAMGNPTGGYRRGGMVAHMAEGGLLEEDPDMPFVDKENPYVDPKKNEELRRQRAIPTGPNEPLPEAAASAPPRRGAQPDPEAAQSVAAQAQAAVADAAPSLVEDAKAPKAAVGPDADTERMDLINNQGGLSMDEYKQIISTIDPNGEIPAYLKSAAALAATHRYFLEQGQPEKARRVAKGILILNKEMTQTLGALAQNAMEDGDVASAARLVSDAANQFPTGHQFQVGTGPNGELTYTVMENGKEVNKGALSPDQLWELTGKVKDGSLFIEQMGRMAGAGSETKRVGPTEALDLTANAYANAMKAAEALALATEDGADTEELNALRDKARNAKATYDKFYNNSIDMGVKRTDIEARAEQMLEMAIPGAEQPEDGIFSSQEGGVTSEGNAVEFDNLPAPRSREERDALPPGTQYVAPDGSIRTR